MPGDYYNARPQIGRLENTVSADGITVQWDWYTYLQYDSYDRPYYMHKTGDDDPTTVSSPISFTISGNNLVRAGAYIRTNYLPQFASNFSHVYPFEIRVKYIDNDDNISYFDFGRSTPPTNGTVACVTLYTPDHPSMSEFETARWGDIIATSRLTPVQYHFALGIPVFATEWELDDYLKTGNDEGGLNPIEGEGEKLDKYIYCDVKETHQPIKNGATPYGTFNLDIPYDKTRDKIDRHSGSRPVAGYVMDSATTYANIELIENDNIRYTGKLKEKIAPAGAIAPTREHDALSDCRNPAWTWKELNKVSTGLYYFGMIKTNIPIFATREKAIDYLHGLIDDDEALTGEGFDPDDNDTGDDVDETEFNDINGESIGSECLCLNATQTRDFFNTLFSTDDTLIGQIKKGLEMFGSDPASFIVDYFCLPFDASVFADLTSSTYVNFGNYTHQFTYDMPRTSNIAPKMVDCFSTYITGGFNDWRDYASNYYLFLPYVGFTSIDVNKFMYKTMSCRVSVDIRTGQIKYFLLADNILIDTFETVCRVSMPIESNNLYSQAREKLDGITNVVSNVGKTVTGDVLGGGVGIAGSVGELFKPTQLNVNGSCSPSNAWLDPSICMLIIQTPELIYDDGIPANYGYPDNRVTKLGNMSGYVVCDDVILNGFADCSDAEKTTIKSLIQNGVIM